VTQRRNIRAIRKFTYGASWNYYTPSQEQALQGSPRASDVLYGWGPSRTHGFRCARCLRMFRSWDGIMLCHNPFSPPNLLRAISDFARARIHQPRGVWRSSDLFWTAFSMHFSAVLQAFLWGAIQLVFFFLLS